MRMAFSKAGMRDSRPAIDLADYRAELHAWLDAHHDGARAAGIRRPERSTTTSPRCSG